MNKENQITSEKTWDTIAKSFDKTRRKPWNQCINFIDTLSKNSIIVDIGCGNGRHLIPSGIQCEKVIGLDISRELLKITKNKLENQKLNNTILLHANSLNLPIKNKSIDAVLYIASLHNIKDKKNRIQALKEINRILKPNGKAIISVWSRWQDKYRKLFFKKWFNKLNNEEFGDIDIYWRQHGFDIPRFYHLYSKNEFIKDINVSGLKILNIEDVKLHSKKYPDNFFAIVSTGL